MASDATRRSALVEILFTACPPGPLEREKVTTTSLGEIHTPGASAMSFSEGETLMNIPNRPLFAAARERLSLHSDSDDTLCA